MLSCTKSTYKIFSCFVTKYFTTPLLVLFFWFPNSLCTTAGVDFTPIDYQLVVNVVIGVGAGVLGSLLLTACVLLCCVIVVPCYRRCTKVGKHKPLTNEDKFDRKKNDRQTKT